jgi:AbrB family looped-hinge helix DNA binding protein
MKSQVSNNEESSSAQALLNLAREVRELLKEEPLPSDLSVRHDCYLWEEDMQDYNCHKRSKGARVEHFTATIQSDWKITIPKKIREELGVVPGSPVLLEVREGLLYIKPYRGSNQHANALAK